MLLHTIALAIWLLGVQPPEPLTEWERVALSVTISALGGGGIMLAWRVLKSGEKVWRELAADYILTKEFCDAVNACRKQAEWDFTEKVRAWIEEHENEEYPHGKWRHDHYNDDHAKHELRIVALERRGGRRETDNP
jgi:hypothetical protein